MKLGKENLRKKTVKSETANGTIERIQSKLESRGVGVLIRRARRTLGVERAEHSASSADRRRRGHRHLVRSADDIHFLETRFRVSTIIFVSSLFAKKAA